MTGEVVNYSNNTKKIYAVSDMEYLPGKLGGLLDVAIMIARVTQCDGGNAALKLPQGEMKLEFRSREMRVTQDGYILTRRGHLHGMSPLPAPTARSLIRSLVVRTRFMDKSVSNYFLRDSRFDMTRSARSHCGYSLFVKLAVKVHIDIHPSTPPRSQQPFQIHHREIS
jgi:hypothetical protein